jgi:hypothetical protein
MIGWKGNTNLKNNFVMEKNKKFYVIANKKTGKFYKTNACIKHGEFAVKLTSVNLEGATVFKKKEQAQSMFNHVEDKKIFKQWLAGTIAVAEITYEINYI